MLSLFEKLFILNCVRSQGRRSVLMNGTVEIKRATGERSERSLRAT